MKLLDLHPSGHERQAPRSPEVIFREAKQRQLRRRLAVGAAVVLVAGVVAAVASILTSGAGTAPPRSAQVPSVRPAGTGFRWQRVVTASAPSARISAPTAYDPGTRQLVLIGGIRLVEPTLSSPAETETVLGDTWLFAHGNWSQMTSGPAPPVGAHPDVVAYDPARKALILVTAPAFAAGTTRVTRPSATWTWTGSHWSELLGSGPRWGTGSALMAYDVATHQLVFAPSPPGPNTHIPSTYVLGTSGWLREPKPPYLAWSMAYDPVTRRLVGQDPTSGSMWGWTGKRWQLLERRLVVHLHTGSVYGVDGESANWVTDESANEIIVLGTIQTGPSVHTRLYTWLGGAWYPIEAAMNPASENPQNFSLAYDGSVHGVVAFGGSEGERTSSGAWITGGNSTWELVRSR